jgi:hypothetical protein
LAGLAAADRELLAELNKKQTGTSLQIEEIYDLVKEQGLLRETALAEKDRADQLALAAIGLADLLEDFCAYAGQSGSDALNHQARLLRENSGGILLNCGILRSQCTASYDTGLPVGPGKTVWFRGGLFRQGPGAGSRKHPCPGSPDKPWPAAEIFRRVFCSSLMK